MPPLLTTHFLHNSVQLMPFCFYDILNMDILAYAGHKKQCTGKPAHPQRRHAWHNQTLGVDSGDSGSSNLWRYR
jgi:hypothetical protein